MGLRLLFVDDEDLLRELYSSLGSVVGAEHEIVTAATGREGLKIIAEKPVDIVVSDLAMPEMNGVEFLAEVVREHPESARIVISGFADQMKVAECLSVGHRFLNKPVNLKTLSALLRRICKYSYLVTDPRVRRVVCGDKTLPTPPASYLRLTELLNSEYSDIDEVGVIVEQDPGLTTKLLQIVNSAHFGTGRQITSAAEAVQFVGVEVLRALILGSKVFNFYEQSPFVRKTFANLWQHSLATAVTARKLALFEGLSTQQAEECFLAGLLHDVGKLILASANETEYQLVLASATNTGWTLPESEEQAFGADHAQVGAYLLALWGVPESVIKGVELHHHPDLGGPAEFGCVLAVHAAQNLDPEREKYLNREVLERLGLTGRIEQWKSVLDQES